MPKEDKSLKNKLKSELKTITDAVNIDLVNEVLRTNDINKIEITSKTLENISKWCLDGKSQTEIRNNLELSPNEWNFLLKTCPAIVVIMQHSLAYADMVVGGTLLQVGLGGKKVKKQVLVKVKDYKYNEETQRTEVVGEHYEKQWVEEELPPNANVLMFLAENKLSEQFGGSKSDSSKEHRKVIDALTEEEIKAIEQYRNS